MTCSNCGSAGPVNRLGHCTACAADGAGECANYGTGRACGRLCHVEAFGCMVRQDGPVHPYPRARPVPAAAPDPYADDHL